MKTDSLRFVFTNLTTILLMGGVFYALVLYPYQLDDLVKGAMIGWVTLALNSIYNDQAVNRAAHQQQKAFDAGLAVPVPTVSTEAVISETV